ncbi:hypothetical protein BDV18DRAFT_168363 [Aspergillus unguis]
MATSKCDIKGVDYEKKYLQTMDQVTTKMAGALGFKNTAALWELYLTDPATRPILIAWLDIRKRRFDASLKPSHMTIRPAIVNWAFEQKLQPLISRQEQPVLGADGVIEKTLAPLTCLWFSFKLIKAKPSLFIRSQLTGNPIHVDPYDITHAYKLLSWIYRKQKGSKIPASKPHCTAAEPPVYFHKGIGATTTAGPDRAVEDLFGVTSQQAIQAMANADAVAGSLRDEDAVRTAKLDVVGEIAEAVYSELNPARQVDAPRSVCVSIDRVNLLEYLMEVDAFRHDCILWERGFGEDTAPSGGTQSTAASTSSKAGQQSNISMATVASSAGLQELPNSRSPTSLLRLEYLICDLTTANAQIPACHIATIELVNPERIQAQHDKRYAQLTEDFNPNLVSKNGYTTADPCDGSHAHRCALRRLCLLAFSTRLDQFVSRVNARYDLTDPLKDHAERQDRGFALYYANTALDPAVPMPSSPLLQASYLAMETPKLRYLLKILHDEGAFNESTSAETKPPWFIVVAHWPLILWVIEMFLNSLCISFVTIRPSMSAKDRRKAISTFVSMKKSCQVLLTNFNCKSKAQNLHTVCSRMVIMEPPLNMERTFEAISAIHRSGQKEEQKVWLLFQDQTFSRWMEANNTLNAVSVISRRVEKPFFRNRWRFPPPTSAKWRVHQPFPRRFPSPEPKTGRGSLSHIFRHIFGPHAGRRAQLRLWNFRHETIPAFRHRAQARVWRALVSRQARLAKRLNTGKLGITDLLVGRRRRRRGESGFVGGLLVPFEKEARAAGKGGPMSEGSSTWSSGYGYGNGRVPGARRKKVFEYLKAANDMRQSYTASWTAQLNASRDLGDEYMNTPGAFPDVEIARAGNEEMVIFPSYARRLDRDRINAQKLRRRDSIDSIDEYRGLDGAQEHDMAGWDVFDDDDAVVAVDVRGWVYAPYKGPLTRKQRLVVALARRLSGVPAPNNSEAGLDGNQDEVPLPRMTERREQEIAETEAQSIIRNADKGNEVNLNAASAGLDEDGPGLQRVPTSASVQSAQSAQLSKDELSIANAHLVERIKPFLSSPMNEMAVTVFFFNDQSSQSKNIITNESGHFALRASLPFVPTHVRVLASEDLSAVKPVEIIESTGHSAIASGAKEMCRNIFARELSDLTVEGVPEWYNSLAKVGVDIHYVSNSPWQLYPLLDRFFKLVGLPPGSFHLKQYSGMLQGIFEPTLERKKAALEQIMQDFPERQFILVGDSGESDLEVYTDLVMANPGRIIGIFIRDVTTSEKATFFEKSVNHLEHTPSRVRSNPELADHTDSAPNRPTLPPRPPRMASDTVSEKKRESENLIDLSDEPEKPTNSRTPPSVPSKPSSLRSVTNTTDLAERPKDGVKRKPVPPLPRRPGGSDTLSPGGVTSGRSSPGDRNDSSSNARQEGDGVKRAPPPPPPRRSNTGASTNSAQMNRPILDQSSRSSSPRPSQPSIRSPASNPSLSRSTNSDIYPPSRTSTNSSTAPRPPLPNKREELWRRRWERASDELSHKGVVLGSWRVGQDAQDISLWLVKEAMKESRSRKDS